MSLTTTTAASTRNLTTVEAVMQDIGADGVGADLLLIESLIAQASRAIERACGTIFAQQVYTEIAPMDRSCCLLLRYTPIVAVTSVLLDTTAVTDYRIESAEAGILYRLLGWGAYGSTYDVQVQYCAGFVLPAQVSPAVPTGPALPGDIERAALECVKIWHAERVPSARVSSKTFGLTGDTISYRISAHRESLPPLALRLLYPYMRLALR